MPRANKSDDEVRLRVKDQPLKRPRSSSSVHKPGPSSAKPHEESIDDLPDVDLALDEESSDEENEVGSSIDEGSGGEVTDEESGPSDESDSEDVQDDESVESDPDDLRDDEGSSDERSAGFDDLKDEDSEQDNKDDVESQLSRIGDNFKNWGDFSADKVIRKSSGNQSKSATSTADEPSRSTDHGGDVVEPEETRATAPDEYEHDSSDEEDLRNTVGNIPMEWYKDYAHIGYDLDGKKIIKPKESDALDFFLDKMENPDFWRTVDDKMTGQKVILSEEDVNIIRRLQRGKVGDASYNPYEPWIDFFSNKVLNMPVTAHPPHKRSFLPSKTENQKISRMVHAIKMGWMKMSHEIEKKDEELNFYTLWNVNDDGEPMRRIVDHVPAPKLKLPSHAESYNPPTEFLFNEKERQDWEKFSEEPWRRKYNFLPKKYDCLRKVPGYERFVRERFERCMDLYLAPRMRRTRLSIEPEDLMPKLPKPRELQPFPTTQSMIYDGHKDMVRSISVEPFGQFIVSGSDDKTVKVWEISTGRCVKTFDVGGVVKCVAWGPSQTVSIVAVACDEYCYIINPGVGDKLICGETDTLLRDPPEQDDTLIPQRMKTAVTWETPTDEQWALGIRVVIKHFKPVKEVTWHGKGDYFATVMPEGQNRSVIIHQLSKRKSQQPFLKAKGLVQSALFHPIRPYLFVATRNYVRIYNLVKQELSKKLVTSAKWISSIAVHPGGDNVLVGTYDTRVQWFDLDLSTKPYKVLRHHKKAVRAVAYHKRYPLFATCSDEGTVTVFHGMVYNDLLQNPLIVPVKVLRGHTIFDDFSVLDCCFHPTQPWVFSSGADFTIRLYT